MNTKSGETIPEDLAEAIQAGPGMLEMWDRATGPPQVDRAGYGAPALLQPARASYAG